MDNQNEERDGGRRYVTNSQLQLELQAIRTEAKALRSDLKLWALGAVALNQFLGAVDIPTSVNAALVLGIIGKAFIAAVLRS